MCAISSASPPGTNGNLRCVDYAISGAADAETIQAVAARKNLFSIGRRGHRGDENQLTEMMAYLLQQEPQLIHELVIEMGLPSDEDWKWKHETQRAVPAGFLDLSLYVPGKALVILESKLGSVTDFAQLAKYVSYAKHVEATSRALVLTTQHPHDWPPGIVDVAKAGGVELIQWRWQRIANALARSDSQLAGDFVEMLNEEGLAMPEPIGHDDWATWNRGNEVTRRLSRLLQEATPALTNLVPGFKKSGSVVLSSNGLIYRLHHFDGVSLGAAFWPRREQTLGDAVAITYLLNTSIPAEERLAEGQRAVDRAADDAVMMSGWSEGYVQRGLESRHVLVGPDFEHQVRQLVDFVRDSITFFSSLGYVNVVSASAPE
jgi:hypothetical protein